MGETTFPVWPTWCWWSIQPASTTARDAPTAPPSAAALARKYPSLTAIDVAQEITGADQVNTLGFCVGGTILTTTPYNENQPSYGPEVTAAMAGKPDALYLVSTPGDGATIARNWISQGGVRLDGEPLRPDELDVPRARMAGAPSLAFRIPDSPGNKT